MLTREENDRLTRVGAGSPMGETMRRYWIPALMSWELSEPDGAPVRVRLLGEDLVAFRQTDGRVGLLDEFCPHRRTSLWLGRNEENGLRCVYHGWKFDIEGRCVEQMNEPRQFCDKVRTTAYPTCELGGIVWAYMGPKERQPAPPEFEFAHLPETHRQVSKVWQASNWLQALEGGIDSSHFTILHRALRKNPLQPGVPIDSPGVRGRAPAIEVDVTDYGYRYFGVRPLGDDQQYVRGYHFVMPFTQLRPPGPDLKQVHGHFWVPVDDQNTMVWNFYYAYGGELRHGSEDGGNGYGSHVDPKNGFRPIRNRANDWLIDRKMQKTETFTGIDGINQQDRAVQESMGPIVDRTRENLGPADRAVVATRRLLLEAVDTVERGGDPRGTGPEYYEARAAEAVLNRGADWRRELIPLMHPQTGGGSAPVRRAPKSLEAALGDDD